MPTNGFFCFALQKTNGPRKGRILHSTVSYGAVSKNLTVGIFSIALRIAYSFSNNAT